MDVNNLSRRNFLTLAGLAGAGLGLAACSVTVPDPTPTNMEMGNAGTPAADDAEAMDKMHKAGVDTFLANAGKDDVFWRKPMTPTMDGNVKVFNLTCTEGKWNTTPDQAVDAMMYNGMVPGPEIRVQEGDQVRVIVKNEMKQSTGVHFHGLRVPNKMDGVPFITQDPIKPGETFTYEFTVTNFGTHMYHSHHNAAEQVTKGLFGSFIVEPKEEKYPVDAEYVIALNDTGIGLTLNGKSFPYTQPLSAKLGQKIRVRYMNEGLLIHPFHLHGMPQTVIAKDGYYLPNPYMVDTLNVAPGERYDVIVDCDTAGVWAYHCHILTHAESAHGMFGMVTVLIVQ